jgi:hypothetical protein
MNEAGCHDGGAAMENHSYHRRYVLITAAKNEEGYIEGTIKSVIAQGVRPHKWVIVSDGSTDRTDEIVKTYEAQYNFIIHMKLAGQQKRHFGSQVNAINLGYGKFANEEFEYVGNLDADISFDSAYYETLIHRFEQNSRLGLAGGYIYEESRGAYYPRPFNHPDSVPHAIQLFTRKCYESIGGYIPLPYGGPDWVAVVSARMKGWDVRAFEDLVVYHHRPTASADGILKGAFRQGLMDYNLGCHPALEFLRCCRRMGVRPFMLYALSRMTGFGFACLKREKRQVSSEFIEYLRKEEVGRLRSLFKARPI